MAPRVDPDAVVLSQRICILHEIGAAGQVTDTRTVKVLFFGPLRDIVGAEEFSLPLDDSATGQSAFEALVRKFPALAPWRTSLRLAVNKQYAAFEHRLGEGDEICFIPPVSGG